MKFYKRLINKLLRYREMLRHTFEYLMTPPKKRIVINSWIKLKNNRIEHNNWGDDINFYLLSCMMRRKIFFSSYLLFGKKIENYLCIGSVIDFLANGESIIWGSGIMHGNKPLSVKPKNVLAVRGPLTRDFLISNGIHCPKIYGDPALLFPFYYTSKVDKKYKLGIIPHYVDRYNPFVLDLLKKEPDKVCVINMKGYKKWNDVIDDICQCEFIISSSLHGLIISDVYNVPNVWVEFSHKISGGHFKYLDYFKSVNRQTMTPKKIDCPIEISDILLYRAEWSPITFNPQPLLNCCPFIFD